MKFLKFKLFAFILALTTVVGCELGDDDGEQVCFSQVYAPATEVTGPETATINQEVTYFVKFNVTNSCGTFYNFAVSTGFPKQVAAVVNYDGCSCTAQTTSVTKSYKYTPTQAGSYLFQFYAGNNIYIEKTLTVTE
jgi:hypothetical protein